MTTLVFFQNPRLLIVAILTIVAAGVGSYWQLPRMEDPILKKRVGVVTTLFPGATASQMESLIAIPIEQELESFGSVQSIKTNCRANIANVVIELDDAVSDVEVAWSTIRDRIARIGEDFPEASEAPKLEIFPLKAFATIIAIHSEDAGVIEARSAAKDLKNELYSIPGTESVSLYGDPGLELSVRISPRAMIDHGFTLGRLATEVKRAITGESVGIIDSDQLRMQFTQDDSPGVAQRIRDLSLVDIKGQQGKIDEIANVELRRRKSKQEKCLIDGRESIVVAAMVDDQHHVDYWAGNLRETLANFKTRYPGLEIEEIFSQQTHISGRMSRLFRNLVFSAVSVTLVVLLMMGWKSMIVVVIALPLTVLIVLTGMRLMSIPIHQMSVTGIIVSLGLLIDNAIVVVEEIRKKIFLGIRPFSAIRKSIHHLRFPLLGATVTTALSFLPIALLPGAAGEFVGAIAVTVILAVVASYFVATMILPAIMGTIGIDPEYRGFFQYGISYQPLSDAYLRSLKFALERPWIGIIFGVFLPCIGFLAWMHLPVQFFPPSDRQQVQVEVELSNASSFDALEETVASVQEIVARERRVKRQSWFLGKSAATFYYNVVPRRKNSPYYAQAFVELNEPDDADTPQQLVQRIQSTLDQIENARVTVRLLEQGPPFDSPIEIRVIGEQSAELTRIGNQVRRVLALTPGVIQTRSDLAELIPGYEFVPNAGAIDDSSYSRSEIVNSLRAAIHGIDAGEALVGDELVPIHVSVEFDPSIDLPNTLLSLPFGNPARPRARGIRPTLMNAGMFGEFKVKSNAAAILRLNGNRVNEIKGYIQAGQLPATVLQEFKQRLQDANLELPPGYRIEYGGENERRSTAVTNLMAFAPVFLMLILFLIVAIFRAFHAGLYIAMVGGLTIGLVPLSLATFGYPFGFMAIIGAMGLIGIAINDSIVVMASLFSLDREESKQVDVVAQSVFGNTRHIIATTLTTIAGFVPLVIGAGRFWPPMAIVLAGGILGATFLAIYFVPSVFVLSRRIIDRGDITTNTET